MIPGPVVGPGIETSDLESVLRALERFDPAASWDAVRPTLLPMLPRSRAHPSDTSGHVRVTLPPGLVVEVVQSGAGIAAALLLVPDELARLLGPSPRLLAGPMRDVLLVLPDDIETDAAAWIAEEFASLDPNGLDLGLFRFEHGSVAKLAPDRRNEPIPTPWMMH